ncbi:CarD family transcriptional regulator [Evansella caseinilytica]|uniref:CarD family transcriptional regulator n=1 Tax=Evansella caseinilytica TaxID=1503961 RepID=A0A1H3KKM5_9BACI|nr:CarD family transcriptional regulator [Evansella caseinilytica]SDY52733.1 CarD family transcriptional regulator [Evansella caseinilytica]
MFKVGDHVVYPYHGAGTIKDIEEKTILNEKLNYFIVFFPLNNVTLMLPENRIKSSGLRKIIQPKEVEDLVMALKPSEVASKKDAAKPYSKENETLLKSGSILDAAAVISNLTSKEEGRTNGLHMEDRKNLDRAKQFIVSELMLVKNISEEEAYQFIDEHSQGA